MKFSERIGIQKIKVEIQNNYIDNDLLNSLWNVFDINYATRIKYQDSNYIRSTIFNEFVQNMWFSFFKEPIDSIPRQNFDVISNIRERFYSFDWYQVYDFIEYIAKNLVHSLEIMIAGANGEDIEEDEVAKKIKELEQRIKDLKNKSI